MFFIKHTELGNGKTAMLEIEGPLNSETSHDFDSYTSKLIENEIQYLLIDSLKINFISSEGIGVVLLLQKKVSSKNGMVIYFNLSNEITMLFRLLGFDKVLNIARDTHDALSIIEKRIELNGAPVQVRVPGAEPFHEKKSFPPAAEQAALQEPENGPVTLSSGELRPFVIECIKCSSLLRVKTRGENYCPHCNAQFTVSGEGNAIFRISEIPGDS